MTNVVSNYENFSDTLLFSWCHEVRATQNKLDRQIDRYCYSIKMIIKTLQ